MKIKKIFIIFIILAGIGYFFISRFHLINRGTSSEQDNQQTQAKGKKVVYYRNPMNPQVTSPVPMKDSMGMDYVPVYEDTGAETGAKGIYINPQRQQMVGMKQEKLQKRDLTYQINTVGKVSYDPELYVAQEEYLQALKTVNATNNSALASVKEQSNQLLASAKKKLSLLGMSEDEIVSLANEKSAQQNLYLPVSGGDKWIYMTIYEYEMGMVKAREDVEVEAVAFPGEVFQGKIISITPVLDAMSRSVQARAQVSDKENKLKPEMYVNAKINLALGEKLALPEEAVIATGKRTIVVVTDGEGKFFSKEVKLGQKAEGFYEVLDGLKEGDIVVTSGNFLIDSESRLQSAIGAEDSQ